MQRIGVLWLSLAVALAGCGSPSGSPLNDRPSPPCPDDGNWTTHPYEGTCAYGHEPYNEWCSAWFNAEAAETVQCDFISVDGKVHLWLVSGGSGSNNISLTDASGAEVWQNWVPQGVTDDWPVTGTAGRWTLQVTFDATGSATIETWG